VVPVSDTSAAPAAEAGTGAGWLVLASGVLWPVTLREAIKAWGRFTTMRLAYPTVATQDGPPSARTPRKN
jgi:hypothetical protein